MHQQGRDGLGQRGEFEPEKRCFFMGGREEEGNAKESVGKGETGQAEDLGELGHRPALKHLKAQVQIYDACGEEEKGVAVHGRTPLYSRAGNIQQIRFFSRFSQWKNGQGAGEAVVPVRGVLYQWLCLVLSFSAHKRLVLLWYPTKTPFLLQRGARSHLFFKGWKNRRGLL